MKKLIEREIEHAQNGRPAGLIFKINSLADADIVQDLYRASQAGVKVSLLVRGVCCLRPGIPGISDNIRVMSLVGRFLEHSRIYYFENGGSEEIFIGSADLMERNLDRRVEILCPILDKKIREPLKNVILETYLKDNNRAYLLHTDGHYEKITRSSADAPEVNAQQVLLQQYT